MVFIPFSKEIFVIQGLGAAGEELQIQVIGQQGRRGPGGFQIFLVGGWNMLEHVAEKSWWIFTLRFGGFA